MSRSRLAADVRFLLALSIPAIAGQIGGMLLGVEDTVMLGHVGVRALDASALGNVWAWGTLIFGFGVVLGIDPIVSHAHGASDEKRLGLALQRGIIAALLVSIPIAILWLLAEPVLVAMGQDRALAHDAWAFLVPQIPGIPGFLVFMAFRQHQLNRKITMPSVWVMVLANVLNVTLDWALIYGHLGLPPLGVVGSGIATGITRVAMMGAIALWTFKGGLARGAWVPWSREALEWTGLKEILRFGLPVGLQIGAESWAFQIATLWAGKLGKAELGAHSIALNLASLSFMVPLGVSIGTVTLVGNRLGTGDREGAHRGAKVALAMGGAVMSVSALLFLLLRNALPHLYTSDPEVVALAAAILPIAAAFQLFDGLQVVGGAVLRGMGDPKPAAVFNVVGYYLLALPLAWWLGFRANAGIAGIWWGLALGLALIATALVIWIVRLEPAPQPQLEAAIAD